MSILTVNEFTGKYKVGIPFDGGAKLQQYIDDVEFRTMNELLGATLLAAYTAGIAEPSPEAKWVKLRDAFVENSMCGDLLISKGIRDMLLCFTVSEYYHEERSTPTTNGKVVLNSEGGQKATIRWDEVYNMYNDGVKTYRAIQYYVKEHPSDYPDFKGIDRKTSWFI
jgi:hypothetical protein